MLNEKVKKLLNEQVNKELYSAYLYLDFSNYFESRGLNGFANWYYVQAQEERDHAMLLYRYLHKNNEKVALEAIAQPDKKLDSDMGVLKAGLEHEIYVTTLINDIYSAAQSAKTTAQCSFSIGLLKNKAKKRITPTILLPKWNCSVPPPTDYICLTTSLPLAYTPPRRW